MTYMLWFIGIEFHLQLEMEPGRVEGGQKSASFIDYHSHSELSQICPIDFISLLTGSPWSCLSHRGLRSSLYSVAVELFAIIFKFRKNRGIC